MAVVPEALMARFRESAMQRLERIDAAWAALSQGDARSELENELLRDLHTLKGDARVVGLADASLLCQRLEDVLEAARTKGYRVNDDVDIVVTMTIQFIGMLIRRGSSARKGIDFDGFIKQVEAVMSEWLRRHSDRPQQPSPPSFRLKTRDVLSASSATRITTSTTAAYLELLRSEGDARPRLRELWESLLVAVLESRNAPLTATIASHVDAAKSLAAKLGKQVKMEIEGDGISVTPETVEVVGVIVMHALTNAIDHGIEAPAARAAAGKNPVATIAMTLQKEDDVLSIEVSDDGAGVDIERVRAHAIERGVLSPEMAAHAEEAQVLECLFAAGFSTRATPTEVSGRGIGLDAAQDAARAQGGGLAITTRAGAGVTLRGTIRDVRGGMEVICFDGARSGTRFAVATRYGVRATAKPTTTMLEDLVKLPGEAHASATNLEIFDPRTSLVVGAGGLPSTHLALRRCPTAETDLVEIVWVDDREVVLLRPEVI